MVDLVKLSTAVCISDSALGDNPSILYTNAALFVSPTADIFNSFYSVNLKQIKVVYLSGRYKGIACLV